MLEPPRRNLSRKEMGNAGEQAAAGLLERNGYIIAAMNVRPLPGLARGEIDIIAWDGPVLCFVEVKTRRFRAPAPEVSVNMPKRRQLIMLAEAYLSQLTPEPESCRFDVVSVRIDPTLRHPIASLHKNAFGLD